MNPDRSSSLAELSESSSRAQRVFSLLGIDYCCHPERTLAEGAQGASVELDEVIDLLLRRRAEVSAVPLAYWMDVSLPAIIDHVVDHHHRRTRSLLVDLLENIDRAMSGHHHHRVALKALRSEVDRLATDLIPHMQREERVVFPYMEMIGRPIQSGQPMIVPIAGSVEYPLQTIRHDHSDDMALLDEISAMGTTLQETTQSCSNCAHLLSTLRELDNDLRQHIALENDVLFPRAIEAERATMKKG